MDITIIILIIVFLIIGYLIGRWITSKQKFGDREDALNSQWKEKIANLEKEYEIKLEKNNSLLEQKTKEWQIKYIQDIEELKRLFKESEKIIKTKSVSSSRRSLVGKFIEKFVPFLNKVEFEPSDMHFLGSPIDYIVFEGLHEDNVKKVTFVEIKTGKSQLTKREKSLKDAIENKRVNWKEIDIDTADDNFPDKEMINEETSINELYDKIDQKVSSVKNNVSEGETKEFFCESCGRPIRHRGNCMACNIIAKREREGK